MEICKALDEGSRRVSCEDLCAQREAARTEKPPELPSLWAISILWCRMLSFFRIIFVTDCPVPVRDEYFLKSGDGSQTGSSMATLYILPSLVLRVLGASLPLGALMPYLEMWDRQEELQGHTRSKGVRRH